MKKRKAWKIVLGLIGTMVLVGGLLVGDAHRRAAALLDRERAAVEAEITLWLARDHARPPALAGPIDGNAWDDYGPAFAQLGAMPTELTELLPRLTDASAEEFTPDDHAIHNVIQEYRSALERLRQGARRRTVHHRAQTLEVQGGGLQFSEAFRGCKFLADIVGHEHRMGRDSEALAAATLGLALAQDYGRSGTMMSVSIQFGGEAHVLDELKEDLEGWPLDPSALREFSAVLDRLDASRPDLMDCWTGEELLEKRAVIDADWDGLFPYYTNLGSQPPHIRPSWRCLFSQRITRAQALFWYSEAFRAVESLRGLPPWERAAEAKKLELERAPRGSRGVSGNVILDAVGPSFGRAFEQDALLQLQRTLLRLSVAIKHFEAEEGRFPDRLEALAPRYLPRVPVCPLTGLPLLFRDGKVWSVGKNRIDDGGKPGRNDSAYDEDGDVVWSVKRRN